MSEQEASQEATPPPSPVKNESKPKPEVPPKPSAQPGSSPPGDRGGCTRRSEGNVKRIVDRFSQQTLAPSEPDVQAANGPAETAPSKRFKRPPTLKPKPRRATLQPQIRIEQAPPLPEKTKKGRKTKESERGDEADSVGVEGGRSDIHDVSLSGCRALRRVAPNRNRRGAAAEGSTDRFKPDGKEVEDVRLVGGGEEEEEAAERGPLGPRCDPSCSCACHLQRPGMRLMWVPVGADVKGGEEGAVEEEQDTDEEQRREEEEEEEEEEVVVDGGGMEEELDEVDDGPSVSDERKMFKQKRAKFHQSLNALIGEGHRRLSDPGPQSALVLAVARSHSPPIPPKHSQSSQIHQMPAENEEESIYEFTLPLLEPCPRHAARTCRDLEVPLIKVRKPARRSKMTYSPSDPTSEFHDDPELSDPDDVPPAVPPRVPLTLDGRGLPPVPRGAIPLPQPMLDEWWCLRPLSPSSGPSPQRAVTPPPAVPVRPPPPPPKTDPRRLSNASLQPHAQSKDGAAQNGENDGEKEDTAEEPRPARSESLERQSSFSWLQNEPLYQTYRATVITKEIRRQTVCRNISKTSADFATDWTARRAAAGNAAHKGSPVPTPGQSTLWQDLPVVRDSGVLEQLSPEQCKYQESMFEVLTSEASYLRSLRVLTEHFLDSRDLEETMIIRDKKTLFSNILRVREVSERFLKDLEDRIFEVPIFPDICDIIHYHSQHNFPAYIDYVRNQIYQEKTYTSLMKNNVQFASVIARLQESPQCQRLPFMSFLLLPFQRITRIKMLLENILKRTKERTTEEQTASKALTSVSKIITECNTQVGKMRQMEELIHLSKTLEFDKLKAIPIISQTRFLEKKGDLQEMSKAGTIFNMRTKFVPVYLFLFNDLLLITAKKGSERFVVHDHAHRSLVQVQPVDVESGPYELCFNLTLLENHQGRSVERLLKAPSQSDMHRWMAAFPNPSNPDRDEDEVIYEDWDCPQVQCAEQYVAQQADELTLEPTEIINVVRKTNEGFYEGIRLSDGEKGWFPAANVIEITNEHVRRRNLRERYRVLQAASMVSLSKPNTLH